MPQDYSIDQKKLRSLYTYHPPTNQERQNMHEAINLASVNFALEISEIIDDPAELTTILRKIQEIRMLCNQAIVFKQENLKYRDIYVEKTSVAKYGFGNQGGL